MDLKYPSVIISSEYFKNNIYTQPVNEISHHIRLKSHLSFIYKMLWSHNAWSCTI